MTIAPPGPDPSKEGAAGARFTFDDYTLDVRGQALLHRGEKLQLSPHAVAVLSVLVENRDRVVSKEELIRRAWPRTFVAENSLPVAILALRRAFGDRHYIQTAYGRGYSIAAASTPDSAEAGPGVPPLDLPGVAVLPFEGGEQHLALGHGIAEDLIGALSRNRWLRVIARNSSFSFPPGTAAAEVAEVLGVRYVLEGSIRWSTDKVRVTAQLTDAGSNTHLVSERYERGPADFFALQDELTEQITRAMRPVLFEAEQSRSFQGGPERLDAWMAYQRGVWFLGRWTDADLLASSHWFEEAIKRDPRWAAGHHGLARLLCRAGSGYSPVAPNDWQCRAEALATEAILLDGRDSGAQVSLGWAYYMRGHRAGAVAAAQQALELNPGDAGAYALLGASLVFDGQAAKGIDAIQASIERDPRDPRLRVRHMQIGLGMFFLDALEAAEAQADMLMQFWPGYEGGLRLKAMALSEKGQEAEALEWLHRCAALHLPPLDDFSHARMPWYRMEDYRRVVSCFRRAGWQGCPDPHFRI